MAFERTCKLCGKNFDPKRDWQKFCSKKCQKEYWRQVFQDRTIMNKRIEKIEEKLEIK